MQARKRTRKMRQSSVDTTLAICGGDQYNPLQPCWLLEISFPAIGCIEKSGSLFFCSSHGRPKYRFSRSPQDSLKSANSGKVIVGRNSITSYSATPWIISGNGTSVCRLEIPKAFDPHLDSDISPVVVCRLFQTLCIFSDGKETGKECC